MRYLAMVPVTLMVVAAIGLHSAACGMHVAAVDMIRNPESRLSHQGIFYRYCKFASAPFRL